MLQRDQSLPLYHQLKTLLSQRIVTGGYPQGSPFPSERELVEEFGVSRITVRQALQELVREGLLRRERGRGSFVIASKLSRQADRLASLDEDEMVVGAPLAVREVGLSRLGPGDKIPQWFSLRPDEALYRLDRVALLNDEPVIHSAIYLRLPAAIPLSLLVLQESKSIYSMVERHFGLNIAYGARTLEAVAASNIDTERLHIPEGAPILLVRTTTFDKNGRVRTYAESWYRGDRWQYSVPRVERRPSRSKSGLVPVAAT